MGNSINNFYNIPNITKPEKVGNNKVSDNNKSMNNETDYNNGSLLNDTDNYGRAGINFDNEKVVRKNNFEKFNDEFLNSDDNNVIKIFSTHDFDQYGKNGIPLAYPRKEFIKDMLDVLKDIPKDKQSETLEKFNLRIGCSNIYQAMDEKGLTSEEQDNVVQDIRTKLDDQRDVNTIIYELPKEKQTEIYNHYELNQNIGDLDGIAVIPKKVSTKEEEKIKNIIEHFYYKNESTVKDTQDKKAFDTVIKGFPEFSMTIGKHQHITHRYGVDIHTLQVLQSALKNPETKNLSDESQEVLKLAILMHDFGKKGNLVTTGHATISRADSEKVLNHYNLPKNVKDRVLHHVDNHHWFEKYNKGLISKEDVLNIFPTKEDLTIAKIMAKGDLEGVSPVFHRKILHPGVFLTQEEFDKEFAQKLSVIDFD